MKMKLFFSVVLSLFTMSGYSQVGIGTITPFTTLDVAAVATDGSTAEGVITPRLTGNQLTAKNAQYTEAQNGAIVYVTEIATATTGKTKNVKYIGYYYYDTTAENGTGLWVAFADYTKKQFYIPTILLPTDMYTLPDNVNYTAPSSYRFTVNLFNLYKEQLGTPEASSNPLATLQTLATATDYHYFVLYYDTAVYSSVSVSSYGVLTYYLMTSGYTPSDKTFMSIVIREK